jgi:hypothetical protein
MCIKPLLWPLPFSSSHPHGSQRLFENTQTQTGMFFLALQLPHFQNPCWLRDSKYFRKTVASSAMLFGPGAGAWVFPKTIFAKADVSFFSLEKTVHVGSMLCLVLGIGRISKKPRRWLHVFFFGSEFGNSVKSRERRRECCSYDPRAEQRIYFENTKTTTCMFLFFWAETLKNEVCIADMFFLALRRVHISKKNLLQARCMPLSQKLLCDHHYEVQFSLPRILPTQNPSRIFKTLNITSMLSRRHVVSIPTPDRTARTPSLLHQKPK